MTRGPAPIGDRSSIRGRFAPSPTGHFHLGNVRTALLAWLQVRSARGTFILRIEDLDRGRVRDEYRQSQVEDLCWLGIDWDEGPDVGGPHAPYLQSLRVSLYEAALERLDAAGLLYPCWCTRREIAAAASAPHGGDEEGPAYSGRCLARRSEAPAAPTALRFRASPGPVRFLDQIQGVRSFDPAGEVGDFVVRRKDGVAAYQLAVVVDDAAMGITDVLRGADLLPSTSRQILLYRALQLHPPRWTHVPLMIAAGGDRLAKRHGALAVARLRQADVPAERVVGWLASTLGLADAGAELTPTDLVDRFDPQRLPPGDTYVEYPAWLLRAADAAAGPDL